MKDALGHGSNAHNAGIAKIPGMLPVHPNALRVITKNPNGASVDPKTGKSPTDGFMVSVPGRTHFVDASDLSGPKGAGILRDYARTNADLLQKPNAHIGSWTDDKGKTHLDVSNKVKSLSVAAARGRRDNQQGIFDVARKKFISTGGTGD